MKSSGVLTFAVSMYPSAHIVQCGGAEAKLMFDWQSLRLSIDMMIDTTSVERNCCSVPEKGTASWSVGSWGKLWKSRG